MAFDPILDMPAQKSLVLRMDITNNCNLDCIGCSLIDSRRVLGEPASAMKMEVFEKISNQVFPFLREVALSCEAEPILHPKFVTIMGMIRDNPFSPPARMTTNATLLTPQRLDAIFDSGLAGLTVSIDGYTAETFARIRKGGEISKVFEALDEVVRRKTALGRGRFDYPQIQINYTLMKSNINELIPMIEHARRWELENFTAVHVYSPGGKDMSAESLSSCPEESDRILSEARDKCLQSEITPRFPPLFNPPPVAAPADTASAPACGSCADDGLDLSCAAPWRMLKIRWDGAVYPCDLWQTGDSFGNLQTQSFEEIWMSDKYKALRSGLASGRPTFGNCLNCDRISQDNLEGRKIQSPLVHTPAGKLKSLLSKFIGTR